MKETITNASLHLLLLIIFPLLQQIQSTSIMGRRSPNAKPIDYGGQHPFEILEKERRRLEGEQVDPEANIDPSMKFNRTAFQPIRIQVDYSHLPPGNVNQNNFIQNEIMPPAVEFWSKALMVYPATVLFLNPEDGCQNADVSKLENGIEADLVLYVRAKENCDSGELAAADACDWDQYDRPIGGIIQFCYTTISLNEDGTPTSSQMTKSNIDNAIHELGHVLALRSEDFVYFYDMETGYPRTPRPLQLAEVECHKNLTKELYKPSEQTTLRKVVTEYGVSYFEVITPRVVQVVRNHFNCQDLTGAKLENQDTGTSCFGDHLEERYHFQEMMSASVAHPLIPEFLSPLTFAILEDSGWYLVDYSHAKIPPFGHGLGCDFAQKQCIENGGDVPSYATDTFCNSTDTVNDFHCDPSHHAIVTCDLVNYEYFPNLNPPPTEFQWFDTITFGSMSYRADFCPSWTNFVMSCVDDYMAAPANSFETLGANSRCYHTTDTKPYCLETICHNETKKIHVIIDGDTLICESDGMMIQIPGTEFEFECPKLAFMCPDLICPANCAGRGICNFTTADPKCECFDTNEQSPFCVTDPKLLFSNVSNTQIPSDDDNVGDDYVNMTGMYDDDGTTLGSNGDDDDKVSLPGMDDDGGLTATDGNTPSSSPTFPPPKKPTDDPNNGSYCFSASYWTFVVLMISYLWNAVI